MACTGTATAAVAGGDIPDTVCSRTALFKQFITVPRGREKWMHVITHVNVFVTTEPSSLEMELARAGRKNAAVSLYSGPHQGDGPCRQTWDPNELVKHSYLISKNMELI